MDQKKQQDVDVIADEIVMLAKALKSVATEGTARELERGSTDSGCTMYQCVTGASKKPADL